MRPHMRCRRLGIKERLGEPEPGVSFAGTPEELEHPDVPTRGRWAEQIEMELLMRVEDPVGVGLPGGEGVHRRFEPCDVLLVEERCGAAGQIHLDQRAKPVDAPKVVGVDRSDHRAAPGP